MRDTRIMLDELYGEEDRLRFQHIFHDRYGRAQPCFALPKRETLAAELYGEEGRLKSEPSFRDSRG